MTITRENLINILSDAYATKYPNFDKELLKKAVKHVIKDFNTDFLNQVFNPEDVLNSMIFDFALPVLEVYQELRLRQINVYAFDSWFY